MAGANAELELGEQKRWFVPFEMTVFSSLRKGSNVSSKCGRDVFVGARAARV